MALSKEQMLSEGETAQPEIYQRLNKDTEKRMKFKEREYNNKYEYRDNVIVKKDVFFETDFESNLRTDRPFDREARLRMVSPLGKTKQNQVHQIKEVNKAQKKKPNLKGMKGVVSDSIPAEMEEMIIQEEAENVE